MFIINFFHLCFNLLLHSSSATLNLTIILFNINHYIFQELSTWPGRINHNISNQLQQVAVKSGCNRKLYLFTNTSHHLCMYICYSSQYLVFNNVPVILLSIWYLTMCQCFLRFLKNPKKTKLIKKILEKPFIALHIFLNSIKFFKWICFQRSLS